MLAFLLVSDLKNVNQDRIYFDNAATSFPKPPEVLSAVQEFLETCGNPGRGAHHFALEGARKIFDARQSVADYFGVSQSERIIFTPGCTASINMVLKGLALAGFFKQGDLVLTTALEHNSVMRPLQQLKKSQGIHVDVLNTGRLENGIWSEDSPDAFFDRLRTAVDKRAPRLVCLNWGSNVTGQLLPVPQCAKFLNERNIPVLIDAAQTAGRLPVSLDESGITFFCASGHKGLMGPPGAGVLYIRSGTIALEPLITGGTGSRSESFEVPEAFPDRFEAGTQPGHTIAALGAGVEWVRKTNDEDLLRQELLFTQEFLSWSATQGYLQVLGSKKCFDENQQPMRLPVVSCSMRDVASAQLAHLLDTEYGIATRAGLHCSAICHRTLGTIETGLLRVSFGPHNKAAEVERLQEALQAIATKACVR